MGNISSSLIDGAFGVVGSLISGYQAKQADKRNMENWRTQTAYNTPAMQSARMRVAGIAPYQAAGQIASGSTADSAPRAEMPRSGEILASTGSSVAQSIIGSKQTEIQAKAQESQARVQEEQALLLRVEQRVQAAKAIIDEWQGKFMEQTHDSRVTAEHWRTKSVEYGARDFIREYLDNKVMSLKERVANLGYIESQTQEKLYTAGMVAFDLFLKRRFGESMSRENLIALQLENSRMRTENMFLPTYLTLRNGQSGNAFLFQQRELDKFDRMFGKEFYDTYLSGLLSEKQKNEWFRSYYEAGNTFDNDPDTIHLGPTGQYYLDAKVKKRSMVNQTVNTWNGVAQTAIQGTATAAGFWKPSIMFGPNGRYAIQQGFSIERNF